MILAAREAGDLATRGGDHTSIVEDVDKAATLDEFGIGRDLAAHAVLLAGVPDEVWTAWHADDVEPGQAAVIRGCSGALWDRNYGG